ncbi:MAG: response regulator [Elusimicrobiales bacterium]|nr:response regulator [Elusimicrobiales bacterium]
MAKILIIDDNGIVRDALAVFLSRKGHEVLLSKDGASGLSVFNDSAPELVILDRNIPNMTGSQVLAEIKKTSPETPVIILTAHDSEADAERYLKNGATSFISKVEGLSRVIGEVGKILGEDDQEIINSTEKILIIDDEESLVKMLKRFLLTKNFEVLAAFDGLSALDIYKKDRPSLVLLDIGLPGKNGLEVLKELKSFDEDALIIMVTGNDDVEIGRECLKAGAADYIAKPINLAALDRSIKTILYMNRIEE